MLEVITELEKCLRENIPCVLTTVTKVTGSAPGKEGFKILTGTSGRICGTVGGGSIELFAVNKSLELLNSNEKYRTETLSMKDSVIRSHEKKNENKNKNSIHLNSICGGEITLFFEVYHGNRCIHIFGAGHVAQSIIYYARQLNYFINVYDNREEVLNQIPDIPNCKKHKVNFKNLVRLSAAFPIKKTDFVVILTHNHLNDLAVLDVIYKKFKGIEYIGMIGSKRKVTEAKAFLKRRRGTNIDISNLYAPIGLDIGGETPFEIALSILAEIQAIKYGRNSNHLKI